jgi:hypothetical protein
VNRRTGFDSTLITAVGAVADVATPLGNQLRRSLTTHNLIQQQQQQQQQQQYLNIAFVTDET